MESFLGVSGSRASCLVTIATEHRSADLWLERYLVVLTAMVANDLEPLLGLIAFGRFLCPAFRTPLGCHQISLIEDLLFFFGEYKILLTLHADSFNIGHYANLLGVFRFRYAKEYSTPRKLSRPRESFNVRSDRFP
jgi:hypothetical protein